MTERFTITLRATKHDVPAVIRLRKLLKYAWRALGLRCEECVRIEEPKTPN